LAIAVPAFPLEWTRISKVIHPENRPLPAILPKGIHDGIPDLDKAGVAAAATHVRAARYLEFELPRFRPAAAAPLAALSGIAPACALDRVELSPVPCPSGLSCPLPMLPAEPVPVRVLSGLPVPADPVPGAPELPPAVALAASRPWALVVDVLPLLSGASSRRPQADRRQMPSSAAKPRRAKWIFIINCY
jgi:hypothetical protein